MRCRATCRQSGWRTVGRGNLRQIEVVGRHRQTVGHVREVGHGSQLGDLSGHVLWGGADRRGGTS